VKHSTRTFLLVSIAVVAISGAVVIGIDGKSNLLRWRKFTHGNRMFLQNRGFECSPDVHFDREMRDQLWMYFEQSKQHGIPLVPKNKKDIGRLVQQGTLQELRQNEYFVLDTMYYSYPYLISDAYNLLIEIGERFQRKLENTGLECTRFTAVSYTHLRAHETG
jgi:hypothetical protein